MTKLMIITALLAAPACGKKKTADTTGSGSAMSNTDMPMSSDASTGTPMDSMMGSAMGGGSSMDTGGTAGGGATGGGATGGGTAGGATGGGATGGGAMGGSTTGGGTAAGGTAGGGTTGGGTGGSAMGSGTAGGSATP
jgi:hypothetical protein